MKRWISGLLMVWMFSAATWCRAEGLMAYPTDGGPIGVCDLEDVAYVNDSGQTCALTETVIGTPSQPTQTYGVRDFEDQQTQERLSSDTIAAAAPGDLIVIAILDPDTGELVDDITFTVAQC